MDITREDVRRQLDLEAESRSLGAARYARSRPMPWKEGAEASAADEEANLPPGQHLLRLAVEPTAAAIREFVLRANGGAAGRAHSAVKWLELASPEEVAYLTARVVLNASAARLSLTTAATSVGRAIIDHVDMVTFKGKNRPGYKGLVRKSRHSRGSARRQMAVRKMLESEDARTEISTAEKLHLGLAAVETFIAATGLFVLDTVPRHGGRSYTIRPTEAVQKWLLEQHARSALLEPLLMPMVVRPRRWRNPATGGYLRRLHGRTLVKNRDKAYQDSLFEAPLAPVYEAINHIQETPWRINARLLAVMREAWEGGGAFAGLPPREDKPMPGRPDDFDADPDATKAWKRAAAVVHEENAQLFSQRLTLQQRLWMAERFAPEEAIWFPHSFDFRGRVYPLPAAGLHPQADDPGKALLEFAHGVPLGTSGAYWLAVHIANLFGVDKVAFADRVEWTYDHAAQLIDSATDPLDGSRFWLTADSPWMALAAAMEFAQFLQHGDTYVSHLPVPLDGSNSGLQHFSALLRDPAGAEAVNLVPGPIPSDVYNRVAARAQLLADASTDPAAAAWKGGKITRKIAKRPTMTFVYSATRFGMQDMILQTLRELDADGTPYLGGADNYEAAGWLSYVMFEAVGEIVSAASEAMDWLRKVAQVASDAGVSLRWTTPDGLPVQQSYRVAYGSRIAVHWMGRVMKLMIAVDGALINGRGQANGISPNFVHSLDAAHLRALARAAKEGGINHLAVIHDSFATHAGRTDDLARMLRETFVDQYEPDLLAAFRDEIVAQLPPEWAEQIPAAPPLGDLDLNAVRHSSYLFA